MVKPVKATSAGQKEPDGNDSGSGKKTVAKRNPPAQGRPAAKVTLRFRDARALDHVDDPIEQDLSAATRAGESLFLSCDETAGVERLSPAGDHWGNHLHFSLAELVTLPAGPAGEMDIEGLDHDDGWLWVVGSHSLKRKKPDAAEDPLAEMATISRDPNRFFLGRFPLQDGDDGPCPVAQDGERRAQHLRLKRKSSKLLGWLAGDAHLAPFLEIPSKENGLDIEGIAARGLRVWLGLRGPVLRGWAVVLEFELKVTGSGHLKPRRIDGKRRYRKHLLPTGGMGVRDLAWDGDDLLVLTGPTMTGDGPAAILRWRDAVHHERSEVHPPERIERVGELPYHGPVDHPEGLVAWPEKDGWLVVYDSPSKRRREGDGASVVADVWRFS